MEQKMAKVTVNGETKEYPCGTSYRDIVDEYQKDTGFPIILVTADGRLRELHKKVKRDCTVRFVTIRDHIGFSTYKRSACLVLLKAIYDVAGKETVEKVEIHFLTTGNMVQIVLVMAVVIVMRKTMAIEVVAHQEVLQEIIQAV